MPTPWRTKPKHSKGKRWDPFREVGKTSGQAGPGRVFENNHYRVIMRFIGQGNPMGEEQPKTIRGWWLSIHTLDKTAEHDWRDYQRIKNELCGEETEGVELYPAESRKVDTSNQFHLYVFEGFKFPFGFRDRLIIENPTLPGTKQRPSGE